MGSPLRQTAPVSDGYRDFHEPWHVTIEGRAKSPERRIWLFRDSHSLGRAGDEDLVVRSAPEAAGIAAGIEGLAGSQPWPAVAPRLRPPAHPLALRGRQPMEAR